jgi:hypothetical protein
MPSNPPRSAAGGAPKVASAPASQPAAKLSDGAPSANRKKQKKRQSQAARRASEQQITSPAEMTSPAAAGEQGVTAEWPFTASHEQPSLPDSLENGVPDMDHYESRDGEVFYSDEESHA